MCSAICLWKKKKSSCDLFTAHPKTPFYGIKCKFGNVHLRFPHISLRFKPLPILWQYSNRYSNRPINFLHYNKFVQKQIGIIYLSSPIFHVRRIEMELHHCTDFPMPFRLPVLSAWSVWQAGLYTDWYTLPGNTYASDSEEADGLHE